MKKLYLLFLYHGLPLWLLGQVINPNCDGTRYVAEVFSSEPMMTTVKYGSCLKIEQAKDSKCSKSIKL